MIFGKSSQSERFENSSRPRSSFANSCSQKARLSCSSSSSSPAARQTGSGHSTMNVDIRSSYGYACALKRPYWVSRKANVNASKTGRCPNQTYFEPSAGPSCRSRGAPGRSCSRRPRRRRGRPPEAPHLDAELERRPPARGSGPAGSRAAACARSPQNEWPRERRARAPGSGCRFVPARERVRDLEVRLGIRVAQRPERLLAEDDAESEGRVGRVPLEDDGRRPGGRACAGESRDTARPGRRRRSRRSRERLLQPFQLVDVGDRREEDELVAAGLLVAAHVVLQGAAALVRLPAAIFSANGPVNA